jgi:hypothetical protein
MRRFALLLASLLVTISFSSCAEDFVCTVDYECPSTEICNVSTGTCETFTCDSDDDCTNPTQHCVKQRCVDSAAK